MIKVHHISNTLKDTTFHSFAKIPINPIGICYSKLHLRGFLGLVSTYFVSVYTLKENRFEYSAVFLQL